MDVDDPRAVEKLARAPPGWTDDAWARRLEFLAAQVERDAALFAGPQRTRQLRLAGLYARAAARVIESYESGSNPTTDE